MDQVAYMVRRFPELVSAAVLPGRSEVEVSVRIFRAVQSLCAQAIRICDSPDPNLSRLGELCRILLLAPSFEREVLRPWLALRGRNVPEALHSDPFVQDLATWQRSESARLEPMAQTFLDQAQAVVSASDPGLRTPDDTPLQFLFRRLEWYLQQWTEACAGIHLLPADGSGAHFGGDVVRPGLTALRASGWERWARSVRATIGLDAGPVDRTLRSRVDPAAVYALWCSLRIWERLQVQGNRSLAVAFRDPVPAGAEPRYFDLMGETVALGMRARGIRPCSPDLLVIRCPPREVPREGSGNLQRVWVRTWFDAPGDGDLDREGLAAIVSAFAVSGVQRVLFCVRRNEEFCHRWRWTAVHPGLLEGRIEVGGLQLDGVACELVPSAEAEARNDQVLDELFARLVAG